jgi:CelD/BcsL family acetyltransferase involved in cellulose biosynthesis
VEEAECVLRKPGNKSRLRQLKKLGAVEFRRVTDPAEFRPLLKVFADYHDCRQSASHGSTPFQTDPQKHAFHLALMNTPDLLHVTVLEVGHQIASAHLNMIRGREVQLGVIAHNPEFARLSPGKLHIRFLAKMLAEQGYTRLDLTPGGEDYKERFASGADTVHSVMVFPSTLHRAAGGGLALFERGARPILTRLNLRRARVLGLAQKVCTFDLAGVACEFRSVTRACLSALRG